MAENKLLDSSAMPPEPRPAGDDARDSDKDDPMPDAQNPTEGSDSDSESDSDADSDSSDDEAQLNLDIQALETELAGNPSNYDTYVQYIRALRKLGDTEKLRQAREAMSSLFPLSPNMWREWAKDETTMGVEAFPAIEKLYERGVSDYMSVDLWCDYLIFYLDHNPWEYTADGILKIRNLFERAIVAAGLHVAEGSRIYEAYRVFEQAILSTIGETSSELKEKSLQIIRNLFFRQLSVPLVNLRSTLVAYNTWEAEQGSALNLDPNSLDGLPSQIGTAYQKAVDVLNARTPFEEQIAKKDNPDAERLQHYMTYLNFEQSLGDPARVQILYERAITEFPISADLWLNYTRYLDKTIKTSSIVRSVYSRATRNCPWVGELWVRYLLHLERVHSPEDEISLIFEKSQQCTFASYDEYLDLYLTRVDTLRRRFSAADMNDKLELATIRDVFKRASDYLSPHLKNTDNFIRMYSYWARLELSLGKDTVAARGVWESLLKISGSVLGAWEGYIAMEIAAGHFKEARSLYKRCYTKKFSGTGSEDICHSWLWFEREFGSLEDFDVAVQKVAPRLAELLMFKAQQENKSAAINDQRENPSKKSGGEKRKLPPTATDDKSKAKRHKDMTQNLQITEKRENRNVADPAEKGKAEVHFSKPEKPSEGDSDIQSLRKPKQYTDQCTAFVSNLSLKATYEDLRKFFGGDAEGVVAIRILNDRFTGKSRGLAYVDFSDEAHLTAALSKNKKSLLGKKISVLKSKPKKETPGPGNTSKRGPAGDQTVDAEQSGSKETASGSKESAKISTGQNRRDRRVESRGGNTFAMPRALGLEPRGSKPKPKTDADEMPKSNDEFRNMLLKK